MVGSETRSHQGKSICILSRKDLFRITRVVRQAKILSDNGHKVTVLSLGLPHEELRSSTPEVEYLTVGVDSWVNRTIKAIKKYENNKFQKKQQKFSKQKQLKAERRAKNARHMKRSRKSGEKEPSAGKPAQAEEVKSPWQKGYYWLTKKLYFCYRHGILGPFIYFPSALMLKIPNMSLKSKYLELCDGNLFAFFQEWLTPLRQLAWSQDFARQACSTLADRHFDFCQAHDNYALIAARRLAKQKGAKLIYDAVEISEHRIAVINSIFSSKVERFERYLEKLIIKSAAHVVTIGSGLAEWYNKRLKIEKPLLLRNCRFYVPYEKHPEIRKDCELGAKDRLVLWFGYCYPEQGIEALVQAGRYLPEYIHVAILADVIPRWRDFLERLKRDINKFGLNGRFHFLPPRPPNELITYAMGADIGVIPRPNKGPNIYYSLPNKLFEMIMARLPIATGRLVDIVNTVNQYKIGTVFDETDPQNIAEVIEKMLRPENYSQLQASVFKAAEELCWEKEAQTYLRLINA